MSIAALIGITSFRVYEHLKISAVRERVHQAHEAAYRTGELFEDLLDAETGQRGYLLTGSPAYLQPYRAAMSKIPVALKAFQVSTEQVGIEPERCLQIQQATAQKVKEISTTVSLYDQNKKQAAIDLLLSNVGNRLMQQLRKNCDLLRPAYFQWAEQESLQLDRRNANGLWISLIGNAAVTIILIFAGIRLNESFLQEGDLLAQVSETGSQYQLLAERLNVIREDERADLAREIHDVLGQSLTAIKFDLSKTARVLTELGDDTAAARRTLLQATGEVDELIRSLRRISSHLRPVLLDQLGLFPTIEAHAREWQQRTGIDTEVRFSSSDLELNPKQSIALFRIVQESLTNVVRHANASHVVISGSAGSGSLALQIEDNGIGFDPEIATKKSLGLLGMQERARLVGAQLRFDSSPGQGAIVRILLQLQGEMALSGSSLNDDTSYSAG
jgi:signal transduction histidine kinase